MKTGRKLRADGWAILAVKPSHTEPCPLSWVSALWFLAPCCGLHAGKPCMLLVGMHPVPSLHVLSRHPSQPTSHFGDCCPVELAGMGACGSYVFLTYG